MRAVSTPMVFQAPPPVAPLYQPVPNWQQRPVAAMYASPLAVQSYAPTQSAPVVQPTAANSMVPLPPATVPAEPASTATGGPRTLTDPSPLSPAAGEPPNTEPARAEIEPPPPVELWTFSAGSTLREALTTWAQRAGWGVAYESSIEYPLDHAATFAGDFPRPAVELIRALDDRSPAPRLIVAPENRRLVVRARPLEEE